MSATLTLAPAEGAGVPSPLPHARYYIPPWRPWLSLYGVRLRSGEEDAQEVPLAPIQALLPDELLAAVLSHLPPAALAAAQCVCRRWRAVGGAPALWRAHAARALFPGAGADAGAAARACRAAHGGDWKAMLLDTPHVRGDGVYVSRNTYIRAPGAPGLRGGPAQHLVCYFRYLRFLPGGALLYRTSPEPVARVARSLLAAAGPAGGPAGAGAGAGGGAPPGRPPPPDAVLRGRWRLDGARVRAAVRHANAAGTEVRVRAALRGTCRGAWNRLDVEAMVLWDGDVGALPLEAAGEGGDDVPEGAQALRRGLSPYVFVPWEGVAASPLNLPVEQMDVWIPG